LSAKGEDRAGNYLLQERQTPVIGIRHSAVTNATQPFDVIRRSSHMQIRHSLKPGALSLLFGASLLLPLASCAGAGESSQRYQFDVLNQPVPAGAHTELTVKLTDALPLRDGRSRARRSRPPAWK
jgi:hypothetical protein